MVTCEKCKNTPAAKSLLCLHCYCLECLLQVATSTECKCPLCSTITPMMGSSLKKSLDTLPSCCEIPTVPPPTTSPAGPALVPPAPLCNSCRNAPSTSIHNIPLFAAHTPGPGDSPEPESATTKNELCPQHAAECCLYCLICHQPICVKCLEGPHKHSAPSGTIPLAEAAQQAVADIQSVAQKLKLAEIQVLDRLGRGQAWEETLRMKGEDLEGAVLRWRDAMISAIITRSAGLLTQAQAHLAAHRSSLRLFRQQQTAIWQRLQAGITLAGRACLTPDGPTLAGRQRVAGVLREEYLGWCRLYLDRPLPEWTYALAGLGVAGLGEADVAVGIAALARMGTVGSGGSADALKLQAFDGPSAPRKVPPPSPTAAARYPAGTMRFQYRHDYDRQGVIYHIGTLCGGGTWVNPAMIMGGAPSPEGAASAGQPGQPPRGVRLRASSEAQGSLTALTAPEVGHFATFNAPFQWVAIDLGPTRRLLCAAYTLGHSSRPPIRAVPRSWRLEASNDLAVWADEAGVSPASRRAWELLRQHENEGDLMGPGRSHTWELEARTGYRFFRVLQTGMNTAHEHGLVCPGEVDTLNDRHDPLEMFSGL
ncbi:hypothetical protein PAPYR_5012 [Paratrimastix pyriformis]|uniref:Uncharacterized protein n=1 Tax=Paratrimastix pyriformis TaxID=342808 RepID=A0ABQ8UK72_9EUKA|nr:hypothetical protein PAPYR_5012 [Paratrimastix pyriformis]